MYQAAAAPTFEAGALPPSVETRFGAVELDPERIVTFSPGPLGFADRCRFILVDGPDPRGVFRLLQCLDDPELAFLVLPLEPDAGPIADDDLRVACQSRGLDWASLAVLGIVTARVEPEGVRFTVNLKAPLLIDTRRRSGCQHVLASDRYRIREPLPLSSDHGG
jgi:flagellar assembly factor FliW